MKIQPRRTNIGSAMLCALCTILIISVIGANVLLNCTTRYNVSSKQVKGWKEALYAAEGGGDVAFSEVRKFALSGPPTAFLTGNGWTKTAGPSYPSYSRTDGLPYSFGENNSLSAQVTVDELNLPNPSQKYYRIRSKGTAKLVGLPRVGMDDRMDQVTRGDSLLRKIDFKYDHFKAKYGDGDGTAGTQAIQTVSNPQIVRRIETIAIPQFLTFTSAIEATGSFYGPGAAGLIDSYDSKNGSYASVNAGGRVADNPLSPYYGDSRDGDVSAGTSIFTEFGPIYGDVTTNGGTITNKSGGTISGTIDNNVPFTIPPLEAPYGYPVGYASPSTTTIGPTSVPPLPSTANSTPALYTYSDLSSGITINPLKDAYGNPVETYVTIVVNGDVGGNITIGNHVNAQIYFTGNLNLKNSQVANNNVDGAVSTNPSRAGHLQFYGISPTVAGATQSVNITPPGDLYATIYAPNADITLTGNPNLYGAFVCQNFHGNGNTGTHYDKALGRLIARVTDYRIASYIEDVR